MLLLLLSLLLLLLLASGCGTMEGLGELELVTGKNSVCPALTQIPRTDTSNLAAAARAVYVRLWRHGRPWGAELVTDTSEFAAAAAAAALLLLCCCHQAVAPWKAWESWSW
jgi:hypothetical protein